MATGSQTLTTANAILREKWLTDTLANAFYSGNILMDRLRKVGVKSVEGRYYLYPIHNQRNFGVGPRAGTLGASVAATPTAGSQGYVTAQFSRTHYFGRLAITGSAISAAQRNGAVPDLLKAELQGVVEDLKREVNIDMYGSGNGVIATVTTTANSTTQTVNSTRYLSEGQPIVFATSAGAVTDAATNARTISTINSETSITVSGAAVDTTGGAIIYIYRQGITGTTAEAYGNSVSGLSLMISDSGTYGGINRATAGNSYWKATNLSGAAGLTVDLMTQAVQRSKRKANGKISLIITSNQHYRDYGNLLVPDRRWDGMQKELDGGYLSLPFQGIPVVADPDCPDGYMYFIDESTIEVLEEQPFGMVTQGDNTTLFYDQTYDGWSGTCVWRGQLGCNNPAKNVVITSIPTSTP